MKYLKIVKVLLIAGLFVVSALAPLQLVSAQSSQEAVCDSLGAVSGGEGCTASGTDPDVESAIVTALDILSMVAGVIAVIIIIIAGIKYITSQGESSATAAAKNTILYAAIGIAIVVLAQTIVFFVFDRVK